MVMKKKTKKRSKKVEPEPEEEFEEDEESEDEEEEEEADEEPEEDQVRKLPKMPTPQFTDLKPMNQQEILVVAEDYIARATELIRYARTVK